MEDTHGFSEGTNMPRQRLFEIRGYLNYVVYTYAWLAPYMKAMHNTIDGLRFDRNSSGWKLRGKHLQAILEERFRISELC